MRNELAANEDYTNSGRSRNPGKHFYLQQVRNIVEDLNSRTIDGLSLAKKSTIVCGLIPGENGLWSLEQSSSELREIFIDNMAYFDGEDPF